MNLDNISAMARSSPGSDALHLQHPDVAFGKGWARMSPGSGPLHRRPDVMEFEPGFPHRFGSRRVKKLVQKIQTQNNNQNQTLKLRLATWNIGTLTGKLCEIADTMIRRKINLICLQETKWVGEKAREMKELGFKLWYVGKDKHRNGVGILVDKKLKDCVVEVIRKGDRIILLKFLLDGEIFNVISAYAPQVGLDDRLKQEFWDDLDIVTQRVPTSEKIFIGGDLNGHVGQTARNFNRVHGGYGYGERNESGDKILEFATAYDLVLVNTWYRKRVEHLVTFKSSSCWSQIDFFLTRRKDRSICKDCKVIPGESLTTQHRLLVTDLCIKKDKVEKQIKILPKVKWWNLKNEKAQLFKNKMHEQTWDLSLDANTMWQSMSACIRKVATTILGETKGRYISRDYTREGWWWGEEVQKAINNKRECFKAWQKDKNEENLKQYKLANKNAKHSVSDAKYKAYDQFYKNLDTKEGEKCIYKLAKIREKNTRDLNNIKCIKDEDNKVLTNGEDIKERWRDYFNKLFNENNSTNIKVDSNLPQKRNIDAYVRNIKVSEVKDALKKMKVGKGIGPDGIPIEVWKILEEDGIKWLTFLFNRILKTKQMPNEWRKSILIPIYKNKGDIQCCNNYRGIKLMSHTMKLWERIIEHRLRRETNISKNQFGFMPGRSTIEAIHLLRHLLEKFRDKKKDLHMVFIDLEKAYDRVPRDVLWWVLDKRLVPSLYVDLVKDMYESSVTSVRTLEGETSEFPITVGVHQGSALSPYLFALVLDEITRHIQDDIPWCMLFADDVVLIDESAEGVNSKLELWRQTLEEKGFKLSRTKTEYMQCNFSNRQRRNTSVLLDGVELVNNKSFKYLGSIIQDNGEIVEDVANRIKTGWLKWRGASGVLCDRRVPLKLKGKFYKTVIRPTMIYGSECWAVKKSDTQKLSVAEMRMLRWMSGATRKDRFRNEYIRGRVGVTPIVDKLRENRLRWFGHVYRRPMDAPVRKVEALRVGGRKRSKGRPKKSLMETLTNDMNYLSLSKEVAFDRIQWKVKIHVADPK